VEIVNITFEKLIEIWKLSDHGLSPKQIAKEVGHSITTVKEALEVYQDYKDIQIEDIEYDEKLQEKLRKKGLSH